ncbi:alpha/beta fold hydrolase [Streptomyces sp. NPDC048604]|uniref:bifunctional 3-oxoadipate enol-lactonase/4-carboxymuconolactone decarboxylase PcaDC n=1 Tax=Streptomyces sp. NPDC048604 TaxID=3365578 RepID=UPI003716EBC6
MSETTQTPPTPDPATPEQPTAPQAPGAPPPAAAAQATGAVFVPDTAHAPGFAQAPEALYAPDAVHAPEALYAPEAVHAPESLPAPDAVIAPAADAMHVPAADAGPAPDAMHVPAPDAGPATDAPQSGPQSLQYRIEGPEDAPVLVLGPSLGTTWHMWDRQIPELSGQWRIVRFDLPGHGGAPAVPASSVAELGDGLLATLDELGVQRFGYAGCSIGGAIGLDLALRAPHRVASLALVSASPRFGTADEFRQRGVIVRTHGLDPMARSAPEQWFTPGFAGAQPAIVEWAVQMVRTTDTACYIAACEALAAFDVREALGRVGVPALVLVGSDDQVTGPAEARTLVAGIADARLAVVPGASHLAPVEQPAAVTDLLVQHFAGMSLDTLAPVPVPVPAPAPAVPVAAPAAPGETAPAVPAAADASGPVRPDPYDTGLKLRREVLGDAQVDRVLDEGAAFAADFQDLVTRYAWGEVWSREGLDRRTRSTVTLTALIAGGHLDELAGHTRAALRNGLTPEELKEILIHTAVYCGLPAANAALRVMKDVVREETTPRA